MSGSDSTGQAGRGGGSALRPPRGVAVPPVGLSAPASPLPRWWACRPSRPAQVAAVKAQEMVRPLTPRALPPTGRVWSQDGQRSRCQCRRGCAPTLWQRVQATRSNDLERVTIPLHLQAAPADPARPMESAIAIDGATPIGGSSEPTLCRGLARPHRCAAADRRQRCAGRCSRTVATRPRPSYGRDYRHA